MSQAPDSRVAQPRVLLCNRAAGDQVRVNIRALANTAAIRREKLNGRDVIIVPSATMPDDVVMNGILYPAAEIAKSFKTLERTPAPLGHPSINGKFLSARDPEGLNAHYIGAFNANVRQEKGRVLVDKIIDVEFASQSAAGKRVLAAIDKGDPVHTSTGLLCMLEAANGDVDYRFTARDIEFDHDALLLDEEGAATPEQGVGMMVNAAGKEIEVVNSVIEEADRDIDWALDSLARAIEKRQRAKPLEKLKTLIIKAYEDFVGGEADPLNNQKEIEMTDKAQFDALSAEVKNLSDAVGKIGETVGTAVANAVTAAMKPLIDSQEAIANAAKEKDEQELTDLRAKIVKANLMDEAGAAELTLNAARALAPKAEPGQAAALNGAFKPAGGETGFKLPEGDK